MSAGIAGGEGSLVSPRSLPKPDSSSAHTASQYTAFCSLILRGNHSSSSPVTPSPPSSSAPSCSFSPRSPSSSAAAPPHLKELRRMILLDGLPSKHAKVQVLRQQVWKILLGIRELNASRYIGLVQLGPSAHHYHICQDSFRTFGGATVDEKALQRVMNAFFHAAGHNIHSYVQGLNLFAGMFLYVMPELDAFHCFERFVSFHCPRYASGADGMSGVHDATKLADSLLRILDPDLYQHLMEHDMRDMRLMWSFSYLLSFNTFSKPLNEAVILWDFLLAFGVHMNVVCTVARIILLREELMDTKKPFQDFIAHTGAPPLDARRVITLTLQLYPLIPAPLLQAITDHTHIPIEPSLLSDEN